MSFNLGAVTIPGRLPIAGIIALLLVFSQAPHGAAQQPLPQAYPQIVGGSSALASAIRFPDAARTDGREGVVTLDVFVTTRGEIETVRVRESAGHDFDAAALAAVRGLRFIPAYADGRPVPSHIVIPVRFSQPRTPITRTTSQYQSMRRITSPPPSSARTADPAPRRLTPPPPRHVPPRRTPRRAYSPSREAQPEIRQQPIYREVPMRRTPSTRLEAQPPAVFAEAAPAPVEAPPRRTPTGRFIPPQSAEVHGRGVQDVDSHITILRITETPSPGETRVVERPATQREIELLRDVPPRRTPSGHFIPSPSPQTGPGYTTPSEAAVETWYQDEIVAMEEPHEIILHVTETPTPGTTRTVQRRIVRDGVHADGSPLTWGARTDGSRVHETRPGVRTAPQQTTDAPQEIARVERATQAPQQTVVPRAVSPPPPPPPPPVQAPAPSPFVHSALAATRVEDTRISLPGFDFRRLQNPEVVRNLLDGALYPEAARRAHISGEVLVMFVADESGSVSEAVIARGLGGGVDERALEIVRSMRFHPPVIQGQPTDLRSQVLVRFES